MVAHIESEDAFEAFQKARLSENEHASSLTESAFRDVVSRCKDDTVGGRTVEVVFDCQSKSFLYRWERALRTSKPHVVSLGEPSAFNTSTSTSACDGGCSYEVFHEDIENVFFILTKWTTQFYIVGNTELTPKIRPIPVCLVLMCPCWLISI